MLTSSKSKMISGEITVPGDKSVSHRALILASQTVGRCHISGLLEGEDVLNTAKALQLLGVAVKKSGDIWIVDGVGAGGLSQPDNVLDMGNSGTGVRLLMGLVAPYNFPTKFTGDESLQKRPMGRVTAPLSRMGAEFSAEEGNRLPIEILGNSDMVPIRYELPVASAQVKSAILLAALNIPGKTTVIEREKTRDHTELMLKYLGAEIVVNDSDNGREITITGQPELSARDINVPADPSSAAFPIVAALITPDSQLTVSNVCINPLRTGLYETLREMGARLKFSNIREEAGEQIADIKAAYSQLHGINVPAERVPSMIDEYPILSVAAAFAEGETIMQGLGELRVKESDRLAAISSGLTVCGVKHYTTDDSLTVQGEDGKVKGGGTVKTHMDHRIAMSFLIMGCASENPVTIDDASMINTSFPGFTDLMQEVGSSV